MLRILLSLVVCFAFTANTYAQTNDQSVVLYFKATELESAGKFNEAAEVIEQMLQQEQSVHLFRKLAELRIEGNQLDKSLNVLGIASKAFPDEVYFQMLQGQLYELYKKEPKTAYNFYITASKLTDDSAPLHAAARVMEGMGEFGTAIVHINELIEREPNNYIYYSERGGLYAKQGETDKAIKDLKKSIDMGEDVTSMLMLTEIYLDKNMIDEAKVMLERVSALNDNMIIPELKLGDIYKSEQNYDKAIEIFMDVANKLQGKDRASVLKQVGGMYYEMADYPNAAKMFEWVLELTPQDSVSAYLAGYLYEYLGDKPKARMIYENAIKHNADYALLLKRATYIAITDEEYDKAISYMGKIDPIERDVEYYLLLSEAYSEKGDHEKSLLVLIDGLKDNPTDEAMLYSTALQYEFVGERDKGLALAVDALEVHPTSHILSNFVGYMYADMDINLDKAYELISQALKQEPENPAYLDSMGWYYYRMKDYDKAYEHVMRAYEKLPDEEITKHKEEIEKVMGKN